MKSIHKTIKALLRVGSALLLLFSLMSAQALALGGTWETKAPMPTPAATDATGAIDDKLFVAGRRDRDQSVVETTGRQAVLIR